MSQKQSSQRSSLSVTFVWIAVAFSVCLVISNIFELRFWQVGSLPLQLTGGIIIFPISYILNDCITEVYGYRKSRLVIWIGFAMCLFVSVTSFAITALPRPLYEENYTISDSFNTLFALVPRTNIASLLAFLGGSTVNAYVMSKMKISSGGRRFGYRAIVSSVLGELSDSLIFFPVAFAGLLPFEGLVSFMVTQVILKTLYEIIILPFTNIFVRWLKVREGMDTYDVGISYNPFRIKDIE